MKAIGTALALKARRRTWILVLAGLSLLMLLATLFYPFGYDQAVFSVGGEMILKANAVPYRDFLDTKPPLIFYIYSAAIAIFGHHDWSIRAFDTLFQFGCALLFYRILRRHFDRDFALLSVSLSLILYTGLGFWHTAQAESFALLPSLVLIWATSELAANDRRAFRLGLLAGIATALLFLLKFTLVLGAVAAVFFIVFRRGLRAKDHWRYRAGMALSFFGAMGIFLLLLGSSSALQPFLESLRWLSRYAAITALSTGESMIEQILILFPKNLIYNASITLFLIGAVGLISYWRAARFGRGKPIISLLALTGIFQLAGVVAERKIVFPYQYARALWAFTPLATMGLFAVIRFGEKFWEGIVPLGKGPKLRAVTLIIVAACVAVVLSPLARIYTQSLPWTITALSGKDPSPEVHRRIRDYYADEQQTAAAYLRGHTTDSDQLFFWGNDVAIYWYANKLPPTICLTATPLRTAWTPKRWRDEMMAQLIQAHPKYFVTEFGDAKEYITGSEGDSYEALTKWPQLATYYSRYTRDTVIGHYIISHLAQAP